MNKTSMYLIVAVLVIVIIVGGVLAYVLLDQEVLGAETPQLTSTLQNTSSEQAPAV